MPLLGRHKPLSGGGQQRSSGGAVQQPQSPPVSSSASIGGQQQRPAVCESPLFGLRRQLPMVTVPAMATTTVATGCSDEQRVGHSATRGRRQAAQQPSVASVNSMSKGWTSEPRDGPPQANENTLGSIPKHITRQQIHYAFSIMDTNSDGLIDVRDLSQMLANLGIPIDESILAHVLTGASKRGDHRMSENEFLEWLGHFVQVDENKDGDHTLGAAARTEEGAKSPKPRLANKWSAAGRWRKRPVARSSTAASSLAAVGGEPPPVDALRKRRGSGSGLALMRSLSSSAAATRSAAEEEEAREEGDELEESAPNGRLAGASSSRSSSAGNLEEEEARSDLRAAFCVFDLDGDGFITLDEVRAGLKLLGEAWTPAELNQLFSRCCSGSSLRANDLRQRINIEDFVRMLL